MISPVRMRMARSMSVTKIFPSPILPVCAARNRLHDLFGEAVRDGDLDLDLRKEADVVFRAPVYFRLTLLPAEALHLRDGEALHAERRERLSDVVQLEGLDDGYNQLHVSALSYGSLGRAAVSGLAARG